MLAAAIDFVLHMRGWLSPIVSIIWSLMAFGVWIWVLLMWGVTEWSPDTGGILDLYMYDYAVNGIDVYGDGLFYSRVSTGSVAALLTLVQLSFAARAVDLEKKEKPGLASLKVHKMSMSAQRTGSMDVVMLMK